MTTFAPTRTGPDQAPRPSAGSTGGNHHRGGNLVVITLAGLVGMGLVTEIVNLSREPGTAKPGGEAVPGAAVLVGDRVLDALVDLDADSCDEIAEQGAPAFEGAVVKLLGYEKGTDIMSHCTSVPGNFAGLEGVPMLTTTFTGPDGRKLVIEASPRFVDYGAGPDDEAPLRLRQAHFEGMGYRGFGPDNRSELPGLPGSVAFYMQPEANSQGGGTPGGAIAIYTPGAEGRGISLRLLGPSGDLLPNTYGDLAPIALALATPSGAG